MIVKTETDLRREIVEIGRRVYDRFFIAANDGNISARLDPDDGAMLVTPTGVSKGIYDYRGHPEGEPGEVGAGSQRGTPAYLGDAAAPGHLPRAGRRGSSIAYFAPAYGAPKDVEAIKAAVVEKLAGFVVSDCPEPFVPLRAGRSRRAQDRLTSKAEMGQSRDPPAT